MQNVENSISDYNPTPLQLANCYAHYYNYGSYTL